MTIRIVDGRRRRIRVTLSLRHVLQYPDLQLINDFRTFDLVRGREYRVLSHRGVWLSLLGFLLGVTLVEGTTQGDVSLAPWYVICVAIQVIFTGSAQYLEVMLGNLNLRQTLLLPHHLRRAPFQLLVMVAIGYTPDQFPGGGSLARRSHRYVTNIFS